MKTINIQIQTTHVDEQVLVDQVSKLAEAINRDTAVVSVQVVASEYSSSQIHHAALDPQPYREPILTGECVRWEENPQVSVPTPEDLAEIMADVMAGYERFAFTYQSAEDIRQRAWELAIEALDRYEPDKGPLLNFLRVNVRNRLLNDKRNKYIRSDSPCKKCPLGAYVNGKCQAYSAPDLECEWFGPWNARNQSRLMLAHPITLENVAWDRERALVDYAQPGDKIEWAEIWDILEKDIPEDIEPLYWAWKTGFTHEDAQRRKTLSAEEQILVDNYVRERVGDIFGG